MYNLPPWLRLKKKKKYIHMSMVIQRPTQPGSSKTVYNRHRMWLPENDPWRKCGDLFNGKDELDNAPPKRTGEEIDTQLKNWTERPSPGKMKKHMRKKGDGKKN